MHGLNACFEECRGTDDAIKSRIMESSSTETARSSPDLFQPGEKPQCQPGQEMGKERDISSSLSALRSVSPGLLPADGETAHAHPRPRVSDKTASDTALTSKAMAGGSTHAHTHTEELF